MQPLKPGKDTYATSPYYDTQNLRQYLVSYHDRYHIDIVLCPTSDTTVKLLYKPILLSNKLKEINKHVACTTLPPNKQY